MCQVFSNYEDFKVKVAKNIRKIRLKKNFTQETFAFELNTSPKYIGCIERAEKTPSLNFMYNMAKVLGTKVEDFFIATM